MKTMCIATVLICLAASLAALPPANEATNNAAAGVKTVDDDAFIDANRILMFVTNHGNFGRDLAHIFGYDYGTFFPYVGDTSYIGSGTMKNSPLYAAGLWVGGKVDGQIRVALAEYDDEYVPGKIGGESAGSPQYRVYKLFADSMAANPNADYLEWPIWDGAPVDDLGRPRLIGTQTLWSVFNDADPSQHENDAGRTEPLGIEVRQTTWAVAQGGTDTISAVISLDVDHLGDSPLSVMVRAVDAAAVTGDGYMVEVIPDERHGHIWRLKNLTTAQTLLDNMTNFTGTFIGTSEGIEVAVTAPGGDWAYASAEPANWSPVAVAENGYAGDRWFTGAQYDGEMFYGGVFMEPHFWGSTSVSPGEITPIELRFRPMQSYTDLNGNGRYDIGEPYVVDDPSQTQNAFMYSSFAGSTYEGFFPVPFTAWDVSDPYNPRQLNVVIRDRDQDHQWDLHYMASSPDGLLPNDGDQRYQYLWVLNTDYDPSGTMYGSGFDGGIDFWSYNGDEGIWDAMWMCLFAPRGEIGVLAEEATFRIDPGIIITDPFADQFTFTSSPPPTVAYGREDLAVYLQYTLYNKSAARIDSCYVALWSDPDLGGPVDDYVGCDTLDDLFFCYNATNNDAQYGTTPPAIGFKFLYGPEVASPDDTAYFDGGLIPGYRNLGMTAFQKYINGTDPDNFGQTFNYMKGLNRSGAPLPNGTHYAVPGDPVSGTGDLDIAPADRRMMGASGPFTFNPGDSQYVLIKMAVGRGTDELHSITKLREILNAPPYLGTTDLMAVVRPEPQYYFYQNAITPMTNTIYMGRVGGDPIGDINLSTLIINGAIVPTSVALLPDCPGFPGEVVRMTFPAKQFIAGYGRLWGAGPQPFTITDASTAIDPFTVRGTVQMIGHRPGDANGDMAVNVGDAVFLVNYVFRDGVAPDPVEVGDANGDLAVNLGDAVYLIHFLFRGGPAPVIPDGE